MAQKLVDVFDGPKLLHTYDIVFNGLNFAPTDADFEKQALNNAREDVLVPPQRQSQLTARVR